MKWNRAELLFALALLLAAPGAARAQGTAPGGPDIMTCAFNSVLPTLVSGQAGYVQCDSSGRLIISNPGSGGGGSAASQTASNASDAQATSTTNQQNVTWNYIYNGSAWDRLRGTGGAANVAVTNFPATQPVSGTVTANQGGAPWSTTDTNAAQTITAPGTSAAKAQGVQGVTGGVPLTVQGTLSTFAYAVATAAVPTGYTAGQNNPLSQDLSGRLRGLVTTDQTNHGTTDKVAADLYVGGAANASGNPAFVTGSVNQGNAGPAWQIYHSTSIFAGGVSNFSRIPTSANSTNLTNAKASVGRVYKITGYNATNAVLRIKFYNAASISAVTVGVTAVYFSKPLPPGAFSWDVGDLGWSFSTGITYALTVNAVDSDATAIGANAITDLSVEYQ